VAEVNHSFGVQPEPCSLKNTKDSSLSQPSNWRDSKYSCRIKATVDSGMYERKDEVVIASINSGAFLKGIKSSDISSIKVINCESNQEVSCLFEADDKDPNIITICWLLEGKIEPLITKQYFIYFSTDANCSQEKTSASFIRKIAKDDNLISNSGFEKEEGWIIRKPTDKTLSKLTEEQSYHGKRSLMLSTYDVKSPELAVYSDIFPITPSTRYVLSGYVRIEEIPANAYGYAIIELTFLDEQKQVRRPPKEKNYRIFLSFPVDQTRVEREEFLKRWISKRTAGTSPRWAKYGRIKLFTYQFVGTVYFDDISFKEIKPEAPNIILSDVELLPDSIRNDK
jgi:hypothetical protein